jgi:hypothetical protein
MQGYRQFNATQSGAEVTTAPGNGLQQILAQLISDLWQLLLIQLAQIRRRDDLVK